MMLHDRNTIIRATQKKMMSWPGHQRAGGIEIFQILRLIRPAQRGERPQRGGEPGIQHVLILRANACRRTLEHFIAALSRSHGQSRRSPRSTRHGYAMAPPQLAADAPVADVVHPVEVGLGKALGYESWSRRLRTASIAGSASGCIVTNHWLD